MRYGQTSGFQSLQRSVTPWTIPASFNSNNVFATFATLAGVNVFVGDIVVTQYIFQWVAGTAIGNHVLTLADNLGNTSTDFSSGVLGGWQQAWPSVGVGQAIDFSALVWGRVLTAGVKTYTFGIQTSGTATGVYANIGGAISWVIRNS